jgi:hypothetical protein
MSASRRDILNAYRQLLGREPESEDVIQHWLDSGLTPAELRKAFLESEEYKTRAGRTGRY